MLIHKTMKMPTSCLSCWIAPTCEVWVAEKKRYKGYDNRLENCPLEEVKHGEWKVVKSSISPYMNDVVCSECGFKMGSSFGFNFCPHCGADMREVTDGSSDN